MIDPRDFDPLMVTVGASFFLGMLVLLAALLVPREQVILASADASMFAADAFNELAQPQPLREEAAAIAEPPAAVPKAPSFANAVAEANRFAGGDGEDVSLDEMPAAPLVDLPTTAAPADRAAPTRRLTWMALVDETATDADLPTRLRLIEALGFIGGSWSIEILARAYEQELDANVRGAIFVALRDSRSAA